MGSGRQGAWQLCLDRSPLDGSRTKRNAALSSAVTSSHVPRPPFPRSSVCASPPPRGPARARIIASVTLYPPRVRHRPTSFLGQKVGRACNARCSTRRSRRVHNLRNDGRCTEVEVEREREDEKGKAKNFACTRCLTFTLFVRFMGED